MNRAKRAPSEVRGQRLWPLVGAGLLLLVYGLTMLYACVDVCPWAERCVQPSADLHFALLRLGGKSNPLIAHGEFWRFVTSTFLHAGLLHVAVNAVGLLLLARLTILAFGRRRSLVLFFLSGLGGAVASYALSAGLSVGASGALFGMTAALGVHFVRIRDHVSPALRQAVWIGLPLWLVINFAAGLFWPDVDNAAHFGGFVTGLLAALLFRSRPPGLALHAVLVAGLSFLVLSAAMAAHSASKPLPAARPDLVPLQSFATVDAPVLGPTSESLVPADWRVGRFHHRRCDLTLRGHAVEADPPWCFVDAYESVLVLGSVGAMFDYDPEIVAAFAAFSGPTLPFEKQTERARLFLLPLGRGYAYVLASPPQAADRYRPLVQALYRSVASVPPAASLPESAGLRR